MLEIINVVVVVLIFFKHNGLCERLADSDYFYTEKSITCTNFRVCVTPFAYFCEGVAGVIIFKT